MVHWGNLHLSWHCSTNKLFTGNKSSISKIKYRNTYPFSFLSNSQTRVHCHSMWHALGKDELFIVYRIHGMIPSVVTCFCDIIVNGEGVSFILCCWVDLLICLFIYCACFTTAISLEWFSQHGHTHTSMLDTDTPTHQHTHTHTLSVGG